jgi:hypothetical protein
MRPADDVAEGEPVALVELLEPLGRAGQRVASTIVVTAHRQQLRPHLQDPRLDGAIIRVARQHRVTDGERLADRPASTRQQDQPPEGVAALFGVVRARSAKVAAWSTAASLASNSAWT